MTLATPELRHLCDINAELGEILTVGDTSRGWRRIIPIVGGTVEGERLRGRVINLGADWQTIFADGVAELDTRYGIETNDGALIDIRNFGYRHGPKDVLDAVARGDDVDPATYYMRTHPRFETADERYSWLNRTIFVGTGSRQASSVGITIFEVT